MELMNLNYRDLNSSNNGLCKEDIQYMEIELKLFEAVDLHNVSIT